jgi:hypothetical protein
VTTPVPEPSHGTPPSQGLLRRAIGVITSPRQTYAQIVQRPRSLGALVAVTLTIALATFAFLSTDVGRTAAMDRQLSAMESFGRSITPEQAERMERFLPIAKYVGLASQLLFIPLGTIVVAALVLAAFNALAGGDATFKQVYGVVTHSWFLSAVQTLFVLPLNYLRESLSSATSLAIFLPMIDDASFAGLLLGSIDLFRIWWIVNLAIGLGVLYKRRTGPIAGTMLAIYGVLALLIAGVRAALSGA